MRPTNAPTIVLKAGPMTENISLLSTLESNRPTSIAITTAIRIVPNIITTTLMIQFIKFVSLIPVFIQKLVEHPGIEPGVLQIGGQSRIRTYVAVRREIYSLLVLTTHPSVLNNFSFF